MRPETANASTAVPPGAAAAIPLPLPGISQACSKMGARNDTPSGENQCAIAPPWANGFELWLTARTCTPPPTAIAHAYDGSRLTGPRGSSSGPVHEVPSAEDQWFIPPLAAIAKTCVFPPANTAAGRPAGIRPPSDSMDKAFLRARGDLLLEQPLHTRTRSCMAASSH